MEVSSTMLMKLIICILLFTCVVLIIWHFTPKKWEWLSILLFTILLVVCCQCGMFFYYNEGPYQAFIWPVCLLLAIIMYWGC
uniref:Uncharacterized protein n=1 Tax=Dreissena rostriformis TaxID=205083 RepID=A0A894JNK4_9BIVA|nr:hypothetical protein K8L31_mgp07 [Dreissena rostriformis]QRV59735.1 hypothetical protein [Dreissena rostriformis]